ncbi:hypothetical protein Verru16b_01948 [Lacunisphaera limnophila]|uniref:Uncharacterized protein n=1 Tax=Lacunisphaera limnophila TaxID=1838286 RepID=A0A1D8AVF8_9BACT|nr:hypothetical protein [Lacunisphaera limnophila]AOS44879.1 hypothetical protein Verru16b_01948 [Lacunisphaera limnophila]
MKARRYAVLTATILVLAAAEVAAAAETVATAVYAKVDPGYKRVKAKDGSYKPEYYALSNGGLIEGTTSDATVDRVSYRDVAKIVIPLLDQQNYYYAKTKEQAKLLLVLNWGSTLAINGAHRDAALASAQEAAQDFQRTQRDLAEAMATRQKAGEPPSYPGEDRVATTSTGMGRSIQFGSNEEVAVTQAAVSVENSFLNSQVNDRVRDELNTKNAQVLGYMDELADSNDIRRFAGGGDRYNDLITEVEESRYYIVISAYDFPELVKTQKKKLLWQTRVSVRSPGNTFDDSVAAMMRSAAKYFGRDSGKLVRGEETKGTVELGELKYLGEAKEVNQPPAKEEK